MSTENELSGLVVGPCIRPPIEALRRELEKCIAEARGRLDAVERNGCCDNTDFLHGTLDQVELHVWSFADSEATLRKEAQNYTSWALQCEEENDTHGEDDAHESARLLESLADALAACHIARADIANAEAAEIAQLRRESCARAIAQNNSR